MIENLEATLRNAFIDAKHLGANELLQPRLLTNKKDETIWQHLKDELESCRSFSWAVAFITLDMLTPLKVVLADLAAKGIKGKLLTADYLNFNSPAVFAELLKLPNVEVKIASGQGFHAKGYLFEHDTHQTAIIGSANLTRAALLANFEWSLRVSSHQDGRLPQEMHMQFMEAWQSAQPLDNAWLSSYQANYQAPLKMKTNLKQKVNLTPNTMQKEALAQLALLRASQESKGLIVSATGTGKTYLAAFDVQSFAPKRMLFVVHREQILQKAKQSFQNVLGGKDSDYGILAGTKRQVDAKYLFATMQSLAKDETLASFKPDEFDYLIIDEAHRSRAKSYLKILAHFTPKFCLGMTATPERTDELEIYSLFDHNIAYEIRLQDALQADMLCPFHYVGVKDYEYQGELITDTTSLRRLVSEERVQHILKQVAYYETSQQTTHGLIFCSRQEEAKQLADILTQKGHPSQALTNEQSIQARNEAVAKLEQGKLKYLITVNIFNEGIDIPCVNQVIMLRNTQSRIVFIQQLGRGLRKFVDKDFVTIIDFIGNYKNNFLIPLALYDNRMASKDRAKSELMLQPIIGLSTINFTKVAKEQIYAAIQASKLDSLFQLKQAYQELKDKLGRIVLLKDFYRNGQLDPRVFANNSLLPNYAHFLVKLKEPISLDTYQDQVLTFVTKELLNGMRAHELLLLKLLLTNDQVNRLDYIACLEKFGCYVNEDVLDSVVNILSLDFFKIKVKDGLKSDQYGAYPLIKEDLLGYSLISDLKESLSQNKWFAYLLKDAIDTGLLVAKEYNQAQQFTLYQQYTRKDVCRLLNWHKDLSAPMYGYWVGERECPLFVTYEKTKNHYSENYDNDFSDNATFRWYTKSPRTLASGEVKQLLAGVSHGQQKLKIHVFIKRNDADGKGFYYLGKAKILASTIKEEVTVQTNKKMRKVVGMDLRLDNPLPYAQYKLVTGSLDFSDKV